MIHFLSRGVKNISQIFISELHWHLKFTRLKQFNKGHKPCHRTFHDGYGITQPEKVIGTRRL